MLALGQRFPHPRLAVVFDGALCALLFCRVGPYRPCRGRLVHPRRPHRQSCRGRAAAGVQNLVRPRRRLQCDQSFHQVLGRQHMRCRSAGPRSLQAQPAPSAAGEVSAERALRRPGPAARRPFTRAHDPLARGPGGRAGGRPPPRVTDGARGVYDRDPGIRGAALAHSDDGCPQGIGNTKATAATPRRSTAS